MRLRTTTISRARCWSTVSFLTFLLLLCGCGNNYTFTGDHTNKNDYALSITPATPIVTVQHSVQLMAKSPWGSGAQWSVLPASAGKIDANGMFTAGTTPVTATIVAMFKDDVRYTATAAVKVVAAPDATITVPSTTLTRSNVEAASIPTQADSTYSWSIQGGSLLGGQGSPTGQFTSADLGSVQISCTVTNAAGDSATGHITVTVIDLPPAIQYAPAYTLTRGVPAPAIVPASTGGAPVTWSISPNLPAGLSFNAANGQITGTSTVLAAAAPFTVTATNTGGSNSATFTLATVDTVPVIAYSPSSFVFTRGSPITPVTPTSSGGAITSWSIAPALPAGLSFNTATGTISGTPSALNSATRYVVTGTNTGGSATATLTLSVVDPVPAIQYTPSNQTLVRGAAMTPLVPINTGGAAVSWQVSPGLPAGLTFNPVTGTISGTPTTPAAAASFTVTATNSGGTSNTVVLGFTIVDSAPVFLFSPAAYVETINTAITPIVPVLSHGTANSWGIAPSLPAGLVFDSTTGRISGVPNALSGVVVYTVTATNSYGSSTSSVVSISVVDTPPVIHYTPSAFSLTKGTPVANIVPTNTGGAAVTWAISPGLPAGLIFDPATGHISGTPTTLTASATYAVTATNTGGTSNPVYLSLAVVDVVPSIGYSPSVFVWTKGQAVTPLAPANNGGAAITWTISPGLPAGLTFDPTTGRISGTPTALSSASTYTVTATNTGGASTPLTLTLSVIDVVPVVRYPSPTVTSSVGSPLGPLVPTNTGGPATSWSIQPGLPAGLVFDSATGTISGTPTGPLPSTTYSVTATNTGGTSQPYSLTLNLVAVPTAAITASTQSPLFGATVVLTPAFTGATSASVGTTRGASDVTASPVSGGTLTTAAITTGKTYWLRATNAAGDSADASVVVTPQTVALGPIAPAAPTKTVGSTTAFSVTATGGVSNTVTWTASAGTIDSNTGAWTAPGSGATATISATSRDDASKSVSTTVNVVAAGTAALVATVPNPPFGANDAVTPTFSGAASADVGTSAGASDLSASPTSGAPLATGPITSSRTYWLRVTNAAGDRVDASATITPQTVSVSAITPAALTRTAGSSTTFTATATGGATDTLTWTASAGTIDANTGVWTAPATAGPVTITATSRDDSSKSASVVVNVAAAATASISAANTSPLYGATTTIRPIFANTVTAVIGSTPGASDIAAAPVSGANIPTVALTAPKTYYLHVTNAAGDVADASVTVTPQTVLVNAITPAATTKTVGSTTTFSTTAANGITNGITWTASAGTINASTGAWTAPASAGSATITATSVDDPSKSASTTVSVVTAPTASLALSTTSPLYGATVAITPTFTGATSASVGTTSGGSDVTAAPTSGTAVTSAALTAAKTFYLTATNAAGSSVTASATATPQTVAISAITRSATSVTVGGAHTATVTATVTHAQDTTVNWTTNPAGLGSFSPTQTASGVASTWTPPATVGTYTIVATSNADPTKQSTTTIAVVAAPVATSLTPSTTSPLYGATVSLTPVFSSGTGSVDHSVGTVTSGSAKNSLAITTPTTFTLTVTNAGGQTATVSSAVVTPQTVSVAAPTAAKTYVTTSHTLAYSAVVSGAYNTAVTWSSGGAGTWSGSTWTAPPTPGTYTIIATSVADPTKSNSTTVTVVSPPVITSFSAANPLVSMGYATTLTAVYTNGGGTARIGTTGSGSSDLAASLTSGTAVATGNLNATTTFTVTVYNLAGDSTSATTAVTVVQGASTPTVSLTGPRYAHTSTLLPDGTVLIAGGQNGSSALATSQLFNATTPAFSDAGTMVSARFGHTATLLANNTVLLTGGNNGSTLATSEIWNGSFAATGSLNSPREKHTATLLLNGKVLIVGGLNGTSPVVTAELYDPATGTFSYTSGNLSTARYNHTATLLANGKVLISGGYNGSVPLKSAEIFDPATGAFTVTGSMATARQRHAAVTLNDGTVVMIGGQGSSAPLASAEIFNSTTSTFAATGSMAHARDGLTATLLAGGKVLVAGGVDATGAPVGGSEMLNPSTGTFGLSALLATARTQHTATLLQGGKVLLAGGLFLSGSQMAATATAELIDPQDGLTPTIPVATTTAPVGALRGQTGLTASIPSQTHVGYVWMITGGTITGGQGTNSITFSMPPSGTATLDALVTSDRLVPSHVQTIVTPKPVITTFTAARSTVSAGSSTSLNWAVQDATSLSIDQGVGTVTGSSASVTLGSAGTTTYTLTATNAGGSVTATTSELAVPLPVAASLTAASNSVAVGGNTSLTPIFSQGTGVITPSIGAVSSGPAYPTPAISSPTTFTLTVTNAAGDTATQTATVGVQSVSVTGINGPAYVTAGHTATYTATVSGSVNTAVTWQTSAGTIDSTGHLTAPTGSPYNTTPTTITVTATSVNGGTPATLNVTVVPPPAITSFTLNPASVSYGSAGTMTPVFTLGTGQIAGLGSVTSGQAVSTGNLTAAKTFTLIVTNLAGDTATQNLTAPVAAVSVSTPSPAAQTVTTGSTIAFSSSVSGSSNTNVTWTATGGTFGGNSSGYDPLGNPQPVVALSANTWTAPAPGTYTITANSVAPAGYSASTSVTVVAAPSITSFGGPALSITSGSSANLTGVFANGTGTVTPGNLTPTSGTAFSTGPLTSTTTYQLTVTNTAGLSTSRSVTVNVVRGATSTVSSTMAAGRSGHTVTLLADGSVLLAGGNGSTTAERYSTAGALSTIASPMVAVRYRHTATLLANGKVLLAGGSNGTSAQASAELFDPVAGTFTATSGSMSQARENHTAALLSDGRVLLSGGFDGSSNALSSTEIYDPVTDNFSAGPALTSAAEFATSTSLENGTALIAGGDDTTNSTSSAELFSNSTFNSVALAHARTEHTATLLPGGSRVFVAGGLAGGSALSSDEIFSGSTFAGTTALTTSRYGHSAVLLQSGQVLLLGGTTDGQSALSSATLYDPGEAQIFSTGSLSIARFQPASTILRSGKVLIAGGASDPTQPLSTGLNSLEVYDPQDSLVPTLPNATITAPASAPNGTAGLTASVPLQYNVDYVWSITNGTITAGLNTNSITFTRGTGPTTLNLLIVSDRQVPVQSSVTIVPLPVISSFATTSPSTVGLPATLSWTATGAPGMTLTIDHGVGDVTSLNGSTTVTTPSSSTTYTLTATDTYGTTTKTVTLTAVPAPVFSGLVAAVNPIEKGGSTTVVPTFSNGSGTINNGIGAVISGVAYPTGVLNSSTTFTATVTNAAGTSVTGSLNIAVTPVVVGSIAGPANVTVSSSSAQFSAAVTGAVDKTVTWSTSAGSINTSTGVLSAPSTVQDIVVTATSNADSAQSSHLTVHVVAVPVATGITAATNPVLYGGTTTITPQFSSGTGAIDQGVGPVSAGTAYTTGTITASKIFTLTVTNASGTTATYPLTVTPQTVVVSSITGPASGKVTAGYSATFSATVTGAVDTSLTWTSAGAGTWSGNTWTSPSTPGTYTLTATAVNGATNTLSVTVVPAPSISAFTATPAGINANSSATLAATFSGAGSGANSNAVITPGNLTLASGSAGVSTGALTTSQTYTLTVTNDAGDTATQQVTVQVFLGSFSATSNGLTPGRALPTATLRADGNVLVAGGGSASNAVDLFNSTALSFTSAATLNTGRNGHTATLLPNGFILIAGGTNGSTALTSAELYNPATGTFTATGSLNQARKNHRAVLLGTGKVLLVGGTGLSSAELYDPATGLFTNTGAMASVRESATASILPDGRVLVAGGSNGSTRLATTEIYDPATATFSTGAAMLHARQLHTATTLASGQVLFAGGTGSSSTGSAELFNPSLMAFAATGDMVQPRQEHVAALLPDGMVLLAGGNSGVTATAIDQAELFNPVTGSFLKTDFMSTAGTPVTGAAATILSSGQVLVTGGTTNGSTAAPSSALYTQTDGITAPAANAAITSSAYVSQGATAVSAHVTAVAGARYIWIVTNGTLVSGQGTPSITFNMPPTGNATLDVLLVTGVGVPSHGQAVVVGEPAPAITSFTAAANSVVYGGTTTITPVFSNGSASAVVGTGAAGSSDITAAAVSGTAISVGPITAPKQYRLTVTNHSGVSVTQTVTVAVQTVIISAISPGSSTVSVNGSLSFSASVSGAANTGITWSATGGSIDATGLWTAPSAPGSYTITATAAADGVTHSTTTVTVVALPSIQSFTAMATTVNYGQTTTVTPVFTAPQGGQATIGTSGAGSTQLTGSATSGTAITTPGLTATTIYTLTVTNAAGDSATRTVQISVAQPFTSTGSMSLARVGQAVTPLPDGTVLVTGGTGGADPAEVYTEGSGAFTTTGAMTSARRGHSATLLANGTVLVTGGTDGTSILASAEIYDPSTHTFTATSSSMIHPRQNHAATLLPDGRVLLLGGSNTAESQLASAEIYDPSTGSFTAVASSLVQAREYATATTLPTGDVLVTGGTGTGGATLNSAELYTGGAFGSQAFLLRSARTHHTATLLPSGEVLLTGGSDGYTPLVTAEFYTGGNTNSSFTPAAGSMATARQQHTATLLAGGKVLIAGGSDGSAPIGSAELFDPAAGTFSAAGNLVTARLGASAALLQSGKVVLLGGTGSSPTLSSAELFDPQDGVVPGLPSLSLSVPSSAAFGSTQVATITMPGQSTVIWSVGNGALVSGARTGSISFTMPASGDATVSVLVFTRCGLPLFAAQTIAGHP